MSTTLTKPTLAGLLKDGNKIICQRGVCLLIRLKPEEGPSRYSMVLLWNTKTEEVIGSEEGYDFSLVQGNVYYKVSNVDQYGVLNTKTGQLWMLSKCHDIEHIHDHHFAARKDDGYYLLDVNTGKELKYRETYKEGQGHDRYPELKKTIEHVVGPYFLVDSHLLNVKTGAYRTDGSYEHVHGHHFSLRKDGTTFLVNVETGKSHNLGLYRARFQHMKKTFFWCEGYETKGEYRWVKPFVFNLKNGKITKLA